MNDKVVEILMFIMSEVQDNKRLSEIDLTELTQRGYTQSEISAAFSWLYDNVPTVQTGGEHVGRPAAGSRRVFHEAEKIALSTESQGYLIQLCELGLLDDRGLEAVIERAMMSGDENLSVPDVRAIVAVVLFSAKRTDNGAHRSLLNSRDTIH